MLFLTKIGKGPGINSRLCGTGGRLVDIPKTAEFWKLNFKSGNLLLAQFFFENVKWNH